MCFSVEVETDLKKLSKLFHAEIGVSYFQEFKRWHQSDSKRFMAPESDGRIYPMYYAPVIVWENQKRLIRPMRYRLRPNFSQEEVPSRFNLFNARYDSLEVRKSWKHIFGKQHCLFPFRRFYEWVEDENKKKKLIVFYPKERAIMWAPGLYDQWKAPDNTFRIDSFALITNEPPPEILAQGHDRCPIFLKDDHIQSWLEANKYSQRELKTILLDIESVTYASQYA